MALTEIEKDRLSVGDTDVGFPFLPDSSYEYFLEKNNNSVDKSALEAARAILFLLSTRNSETVDIFSVKNTSAEAYRQALLLFLRDPSMNPALQSARGWIGGVSNADIIENLNNSDNNLVTIPSESPYVAVMPLNPPKYF